MRSLFETVYLARHGETEWNRERRRQGQLDSPLTERGESYADAEMRASAALSAIADTGTRRPLIVSHEMIGRMLLKQLLGLEPRTVLAERQPNNVVNVVAPRSAERTTIVT